MLNWQQFKLNMEKGTTVGATLDQERRVINNDRHYVEAILVCAQQGLTLKGHSHAMNDSSSNFRVLVKLLLKHDEIVKEFMEEGSQNART